MELDVAWYGMLSFILIFILLWLTLPISGSSFTREFFSKHDFYFLSDVVSPDRSIVLTTLCWCSLLISFGVMQGSSSI